MLQTKLVLGVILFEFIQDTLGTRDFFWRVAEIFGESSGIFGAGGRLPYLRP